MRTFVHINLTIKISASRNIATQSFNTKIKNPKSSISLRQKCITLLVQTVRNQYIGDEINLKICGKISFYQG